MLLVTWNIQWGKAATASSISRARFRLPRRSRMPTYSASRKCRNISGPSMAILKQSKQLSLLLPGYTAIFHPAVETIDDQGRTHRFGNMTLSRLPVLQVRNHLLPWPEAGAVRSMQRHALETTVQAPFGALRVVNTHLEYHSSVQRQAQLTRLLDIQQEASTSPKPGRKNHDDPYLSLTVAPSSLLCGDFNFDVSDAQHAYIAAASRPGHQLPRRVDARRSRAKAGADMRACSTTYSGRRAPIAAISSSSRKISASRVRRIEVNGQTDASDHQPIMIELV